tara:strand:+ start:11691 stop:12086 length:396 start_codon:yes stop_codon:yes gene_type:complete
MAGSFKLAPGLNNVGSYQVSGKPFATSSVDAEEAVAVSFTEVARWFQIINKGAAPVKVGFSKIGVDGANNIVVDASSSSGYGISPVYELKVSQVWLSGSDDVDLIAGLTGINAASSETNTGPNWSGSAGVG